MILQNRWKIENDYLVYYEMRNAPHTTINHIKISKKDIKWIMNEELQKKSLPNKFLKKLIEEHILIEENEYKSIPNSLSEAKYCKTCCNNDFMIPGLEFDKDGFCPICQNWEKTKSLVSVNYEKDIIPINKNGMFDVALFYTGGKDSSFLLWYLAVKCKLRVLVLLWKIPFMSSNAEQSYENAKKRIKNATFVEWNVSNNDLITMYKKLFSLQNNTCCCPSLAYLMFFPTLSGFDVPYLVLGNEPAQLKNLYFNGIAPKIAFKYHKSKTLSCLNNIGRVLLFKKPVNLAQMGYLSVLKEFIYGENFFKKKFSIPVPNVNNVNIAVNSIQGLKSSLNKELHKVDRSGKIPAFVQLDFNKICGGKYDWQEVKKILQSEIGWVDVKEEDKAIHTSCSVEKAKDYSQFISFRNMDNYIIPFTAIEMCCSVRNGSISREKAIEEIKSSSGFTLEEVQEHCIMKEFLKR